MIKMIAAVDKNNVIGSKGCIPWNIPEDMRFFRRQTKGHFVVMGRKTWESLPVTPLPDRINVILTKDKNYRAEGAIVLHSVIEVLDMYIRYRMGGLEWTFEDTRTDMYIIGGGAIYREFLPHVDVIYLTEVAEEVKDGDAYFSTLGPEWHESHREEGLYQKETDHNYQFVTYRRTPLNCEEDSNGKA